jgi:hypothetical protein
MSKQLTGKTSLSIKSAPVTKKTTTVKEKLGLVSKEQSRMRSFRLRVDTIEALHQLTQDVNQKANIKISATNILELLIREAVKEDGDKIIHLINKSMDV